MNPIFLVFEKYFSPTTSTTKIPAFLNLYILATYNFFYKQPPYKQLALEASER